MKIAKIDLDKNNMLIVDDKKYFVLHKPKDNTVKLVPANCPHRGGPLQYGVYNEAERVICPWHENKYKPCRLAKNKLPYVRVRKMCALFAVKHVKA
ncbi:Rieske 2Fe-2S domain-containing protein [Facilibium subflavum]|uniref:Rieske 2Fe-2S domain-containing protein n=1 Tax=Facilibium subflavum TaxID=2219058 RepID=UPI000E64CE37|nr:Rieske 2Fe-2S domain-containing protein [Facilibium subflavum]